MDSPDSINWCKVVWWSEIDEEKQIALFVITQDLNKDKNDSEWPDTGEYYLSKCVWEALNITTAWHCENSINVMGQEQNQGRTSLCFLRSSSVCSKVQGNMLMHLFFETQRYILLPFCISAPFSLSLFVFLSNLTKVYWSFIMSEAQDKDLWEKQVKVNFLDLLAAFNMTWSSLTYSSLSFFGPIVSWFYFFGFWFSISISSSFFLSNL